MTLLRDARDWRALARRVRPGEPPRGRVEPLPRLLERAVRACALEGELQGRPDAALCADAETLRARFARGRESPEDVERACAVVREAAWRALGERPYPEQVAGALAMDAGCIAEMATGEGKTLAAVFAAVFAAWRGQACHVVTVNDYLAARDAAWMGPVYRSLGLTAAHVDGAMTAAEGRRAYRAEITYVSNKEAAADHLRDRLALGRPCGIAPAVARELLGVGRAGDGAAVQRGLDFALVDEADSILIDEAVTPLLISGSAPNPGQEEAVRQAGELAAGLECDRDYRLVPRSMQVELTAAGRARLRERAASLRGVFAGERRREEMVLQSLSARHFYGRDQHYVVRDGHVVIVDEFTGRLMPDRTWRHGFHQAVEAKEGIEIHLPKDTLARISFQRFFRLYRRLGGMTGTAWEARRELRRVYRLPVAVIPVHRPCRRTVLPDRVFAGAEARWNAVCREVARLHGSGRPVLVGTRSIRASLRVSELLTRAGIPHRVLNGVQDADEAGIVAAAGRRGAVTVATNMAGRGTDIKLDPGVAELGGLAVVATERHEARRIDRQLFGRAARQGDPGSAQAFASLEDDLPRRFVPFALRVLGVLAAAGDGEFRTPLGRWLIGAAQRRAEATAASRRRAVLEADRAGDPVRELAGPEEGA